MDLLLGCGRSREKKICIEHRREWSDLTTLDMYPESGADVIWDLEKLPLPFGDGTFDEIHAYDVLEHQGKQGDWRFFFDQFFDFWRMLKPGGHFCGISPHLSSNWAWGDPGHTRIISQESFTFLSQREYERGVGVTPMTDYRWYWKGDFILANSKVDEGKQFFYILKAIK
jgi:hypothetical protein